MLTVAVIRKRLVTLIFNRFKEYLDGIISLKQDTVLLELYIRRGVFMWTETHDLKKVNRAH